MGREKLSEVDDAEKSSFYSSLMSIQGSNALAKYASTNDKNSLNNWVQGDV